MMLHLIRLARTADDVDIADLTTANRTGAAHWVDCDEHAPVDCLLVPLDDEPTADQQLAIRRRLVSADAADEAHLYDLLAMRASAATPFERMWLDEQLGKYGESP